MDRFFIPVGPRGQVPGTGRGIGNTRLPPNEHANVLVNVDEGEVTVYQCLPKKQSSSVCQHLPVAFAF